MTVAEEKNEIPIEAPIVEGEKAETKTSPVGAYPTVEEAFGKDLWETIHRLDLGEEITSETVGLTSEEKRLVEVWKGTARKFTDPENGETKYFLDKVVDDGVCRLKPRVACLVSGRADKDEKGCLSWRIDRTIYSADRAVDLSGLYNLEGVEIIMDIPRNKLGDNVVGLDDLDSQAGYYYRHNEGHNSEIHILAPEKLVDVFSAFHEFGHAVSQHQQSVEAVEKQGTARKVERRCLNAFVKGDFDKVVEVQSQFKMTWGEAREQVVVEERFASLIAARKIQDSGLFGEKTPLYFQEACKDYEEFWQSYDMLPVNSSFASALGKSMEATGQMELFRKHLRLYDDLRKTAIGLDVKPGNHIVYLDSNGQFYRFERDQGGRYIFSVNKPVYREAVISPVGLSVGYMDGLGNDREFVKTDSYSFVSLTDVVDRPDVAKGIEEVRKMEAELIHHLAQVEETATKDERNLHDIFYDLLPEIWLSERLKTPQEVLAILPGLGEFGPTTEEIVENSTLADVNTKYQAIGEGLVQITGVVDQLNAKYNQYRGGELRDKRDWLAVNCEGILDSLNMSDLVPDRYSDELTRKGKEEELFRVTASAVKGLTEKDEGAVVEIVRETQKIKQTSVPLVRVEPGESFIERSRAESTRKTKEEGETMGIVGRKVSAEEAADLLYAGAVLKAMKKAKGKEPGNMDKLISGVIGDFGADGGEAIELVQEEVNTTVADLKEAGEKARSEGKSTIAGKISDIVDNLENKE